jgi:hypothetical protein
MDADRGIDGVAPEGMHAVLFLPIPVRFLGKAYETGLNRVVYRYSPAMPVERANVRRPAG